MTSPLILGIETSCDETAAAVVRDGRVILSNVISSQIELHRKFKGVVPEVASRSHTTRILPVIQSALREAEISATDLSAVAVTHRPGMIGCLLVGISAAKALSWLYDLPLIGVDHIHAHIHASFMADPDMPLPCLSLVASGGHTALYLVDEKETVTQLARTRDDAAGEALDKGAALLGLPYPGGPAIEEAARNGDPAAIALPRPRFRDQSLDFSFSGLKTALLYHLRGPGLSRPMPTLSAGEVADLAASYQTAIVDCLIRQMRKAAQQHGARSLAIGGGVARNESLRERITTDPVLGQIRSVFPPLDLCSDNGAMVAGIGTRLWQAGTFSGLDLEALATKKRSA